MLTKCDLKNPGGAKGKGAAGVSKYLFETEYYVGKDGEARSQNQWVGKGAAALGLTGAVDENLFGAMLDGFGPEGQKLAQNAGKSERRLGFDLTFSADKTLSLLFVGADGETRDALMAAHHGAAEKALGFLQDQLEIRRGRGGVKREPVAGLAIARFDHFSTRELDPDLHSHYVLVNAALGEDGKWRGFDAEPLEAFKHAAGALYRAELAARVRDLGFGLDSVREMDADGRETGQVWHRVAGVGETERKHFSKRRAQIETYMAEHGTSAQEACLRTRQGKSGEPDPEQTIAAAQWQIDELRAAGKMDWRTADDLRGREGQSLEQSTDAETLGRLHRTESFWTKAQLIDRLAKDRGATLGAEGVLAEAEAFLGRAQLVPLQPDEHGRERWASRAQFDLEQQIGERARLRADDRAARVDVATVAQAIEQHEQEKGFTLTDEQRQAVRWLASDTGGVACLSGWAGTGKTATAGAYIKAWEMDGRRVVGTCAAWDATEKLRSETGLETHSTASLLNRLDSGRETLDAKSVILVDEAGMVGAKTIARLQAHTDASGAKLVLIGDPLQLQPVEAGAGFTLAMRATGEARQTEIRRQQQEQDREMARLFYGGATGKDLVDGLEQRGQLRTSTDQGRARHALVTDYLKDARPAREKLVIAPTNQQAAALTGQIRAGLKAQGHLADGQAVEVRGKLQGETREMEIAPGDRLRFGVRDRRLGVVNGNIATVEKITAGKDGNGHCITMRLESDQPGKDGKRVEVQTAQYGALDYGYAGTVHKAQGQGREAVYWLAQGKSMDRHMGLVAYTRQKQQLHAYTTQDGRADLAAGLDQWRHKINAVDLAVDQAQVVKHKAAEREPPGKALERALAARQAQGRPLRLRQPPGAAQRAAEAREERTWRERAAAEAAQARQAANRAALALIDPDDGQPLDQRAKKELTQAQARQRHAYKTWDEADGARREAVKALDTFKHDHPTRAGWSFGQGERLREALARANEAAEQGGDAWERAAKQSNEVAAGAEALAGRRQAAQRAEADAQAAEKRWFAIERGAVTYAQERQTAAQERRRLEVARQVAQITKNAEQKHQSPGRTRTNTPTLKPKGHEMGR